MHLSPLFPSLCVFALQCDALLVGLWHRFHSPAGAAFDKIIRSSSGRGLPHLPPAAPICCKAKLMCTYFKFNYYTPHNKRHQIQVTSNQSANQPPIHPSRWIQPVARSTPAFICRIGSALGWTAINSHTKIVGSPFRSTHSQQGSFS